MLFELTEQSSCTLPLRQDGRAHRSWEEAPLLAMDPQGEWLLLHVPPHDEREGFLTTLQLPGLQAGPRLEGILAAAPMPGTRMAATLDRPEEGVLRVALWGLPGLELLQERRMPLGNLRHYPKYRYLAASADGRRLAALLPGADGKEGLQLLELPSLRPLAQLQLRATGGIHDLRFGGGSRWLAASLQEGFSVASARVHLWELGELQPSSRPLPPLARLPGLGPLAFVGDCLFGLGRDMKEQLWGCPLPPASKPLHMEGASPPFLSCGGYLAHGHPWLHELRVTGGQLPLEPPLARLLGLLGGPQALATAEGGHILASAEAGGLLRLWSLPEGAELKRLPGPGGPTKDLALSEDGSRLLLRTEEGLHCIDSRAARLAQLPASRIGPDLIQVLEEAIPMAQEPSAAWLRFWLALLRHQKRHEVEIAEAPSLPGASDPGL